MPLEEKKRHPFVENPHGLRSPHVVPRYQQTSGAPAAPQPPPRAAGAASPMQAGQQPCARKDQPATKSTTPLATPQTQGPQPTCVRKTPPPSPRPTAGPRTTPTPGFAVSPLAGRATVFGHQGLRAAAPAFSRERQGPASEPQRRAQPGIPKQAGNHLPLKPSPLCTPPPAFTLPDPEPDEPPRRSFQRVADSPPAVAPTPAPSQPRPTPCAPSPSRTPSQAPSQAPARPAPPAPAPTDLHPGCSLPDAGGPGGAKGGAFAGASAPIRGRGILNPAAIGGTRIPLCGACNQQIRYTRVPHECASLHRLDQHRPAQPRIAWTHAGFLTSTERRRSPSFAPAARTHLCPRPHCALSKCFQQIFGTEALKFMVVFCFPLTRECCPETNDIVAE